MLRRLGDYSSGRDNNFNLLRLIASSMVLVSHCVTLASGQPELEPFAGEIGMTLGSIAVHIFFIMSGFLVTNSLVSRNNIVEFFVARGLRIYPGLWLSQVVTLLVVGLWFTSLTPRVFFAEWTTWHSFLKNCLLLRGVDTNFPGAFEAVPFKEGGVNSSLWTLPIELGMYIQLGASSLVLGLVRRHGAQLFAGLCVALAVLSSVLDLLDFIKPSWDLIPLASGWSLTSKFFAGAALRLLQNKIGASKWVAGFMVLALATSAANMVYFGVVYRIVLPYLVIFAALVPSIGRLQSPTKGDYSYGIYIYAYPIQQSIAATIHSITPIKMFVVAYPLTLLFAFMSWHLVEKRFLAIKKHLLRTDPQPMRASVPSAKA